jgi:hypothetical protein
MNSINVKIQQLVVQYGLNQIQAHPVKLDIVDEKLQGWLRLELLQAERTFKKVGNYEQKVGRIWRGKNKPDIIYM